VQTLASNKYLGSSGKPVDIENISKAYGPAKAVEGVSFTVAPGEFVSLLGPSGSGKTTLLMIIAGFEVPDFGSIRIGGLDVTSMPPNKRGIGMVFQKYALFPHRTVAQNLAFPLRMRGIPKTEIENKVSTALDMVRLSTYGERMPSQLSGGQQQRVALARAVIYDAPLILMDEPLGALDKRLRQEMQLEIKQLQQRLGATVIYVTHDQEEALTMSDRVAIMGNGVIQQIGTPHEVYNAPVNEFVAGFLGEMNFLSAVAVSVDQDTCVLQLGDHLVRAQGAEEIGAKLTLAVRPERIRIHPINEDAKFGVPGTIVHSIFNGAIVSHLVLLKTGEQVRIDMPSVSSGEALSVGAEVQLDWSPNEVSIFRS
jgi:mannopine transport system ATP-binding protein